MGMPVRYLLLGGLLGLVVLVSLCVGAHPVAPMDALRALVAPDPEALAHVVVRDLRVPRMAAAVLAGAALGVSGVLMQAVTRNPLADPGLLGVNAGAALAVVGAAWLFGVGDPPGQALAALPGAALLAVLVYLLGSAGRQGSSPVRLALAGAACSALALALVSAIILTNQASLETYRFWMVGSVAGTRPDALWSIGPLIGAGLLLALIAARPLDALVLGDEAAQSLGTALGRLRLLCLCAVTLSCGAAVALTGPIGFVGLVVPHLARALCGPGMMSVLCAAGLIGPIFLLTADIAGRLLLPGGEIPAGLAAALIGGPVFVLLVRSLKRRAA